MYSSHLATVVEETVLGKWREVGEATPDAARIAQLRTNFPPATLFKLSDHLHCTFAATIGIAVSPSSLDAAPEFPLL